MHCSRHQLYELEGAEIKVPYSVLVALYSNYSLVTGKKSGNIELNNNYLRDDLTPKKIVLF